MSVDRRENHITRKILLPTPPDIFSRDSQIAPWTQSFDNDYRHIAVVLVRSELSNGHLAEYLTGHLKSTRGAKKRGLIFLVNEDASNSAPVVEENKTTATYLTSLARKEMPPDDLSIPESYRDLAREVIANDQFAIRVDYVHSQIDHTHFGALRYHSLKLANQLKPADVNDDEIILHFNDTDMRFRSNHFPDLDEVYRNNPKRQVNYSDFDLAPGTHENAIDEEHDMSRELLTYLDPYRLYQHGKLARLSILGFVFGGTPTISGRFSFFFRNGDVHPAIAYMLQHWPSFEDYTLTNLGKRMSAQNPDSEVGYDGEVFFLHRARTVDAKATSLLGGPDGEEIYAVVTQKAFTQKGFSKDYDLLTEADTFITDLEDKTATVLNGAAVLHGHGPNFRTENTYKAILAKEYEIEKGKVARRQNRLLNYIQSQAYGTQLEPNVQRVIEPYTTYFPDDVAFIRDQIGQKKLPEEIAEAIMDKYDSFFNPKHTMHIQIARLRALKKYVLTQEISMIEHHRDRGV